MADDKKKDDGRTVLLKGIRLSFTESLKDKKRTSDESDKESHGCNLILEGDSKHFEENKAKVMSAIRAACDVQWGKMDKWKDIQEEAPKRICFRKGERFKNQDGEVYQGYAGNFAITAKGPSAGQKRPKLLDRRKRVLDSQFNASKDAGRGTFTYDDIEEIFYSGSYADAFVSFYGTDKGSAGVFASIELIRSHQEGERIGGGANVDEDLLDDIDEPETDIMDGSDDDELA